MTLTLLLVLVEPRLPTANALKNLLIGATSLVSAAIFAIAGSVDWRAATPLALGMLIGSNLGPRVTRRVPARLLRSLIDPRNGSSISSMPRRARRSPTPE